MNNSDTSFTFPFKTCESPNKSGVAQPWSASVNVMISIMIFYFFINSNTFYSKMMLFWLLLFELMHTFSHSIHIPGHLQYYITHFLFVITTFSFFFVLYNYTHVLPSLYYLIAIILLAIIDIYVLIKGESFAYGVLTYFSIIILLLVFYYPFFNTLIKRNLKYIFGLISLIIFLLFNEMFNCKWLLERFRFPYHILIEIVGFFIIYLFCVSLYKL
jgi:hypothetical protein